MAGSTTPERYRRRFHLLVARRSGRNNPGEPGPGHNSAADDSQVPSLAVESSAVSRTPPPPAKRQKVRDSDLLSRYGSTSISSHASALDAQERPEQDGLFPACGMTSDAAITGQTEKLPNIMDMLHYIPEQYLEGIWQHMGQNTDHPDLQQFRDMFVVLSAENIKLEARSSTFAYCRSRITTPGFLDKLEFPSTLSENSIISIACYPYFCQNPNNYCIN